MSLMQRQVVPLIILLAVIAVGIGVLMVNSPFVSGQEPDECNTNAVGPSITATDENGNTVSVVSHGDVIYYTVTLSIPQQAEGNIACNYRGGSLTLEKPDRSKITVAGSNDTNAIGVVALDEVFQSDKVRYVVNQGDSIQDESGNIELRAEATYENGLSLLKPPTEASGSIAHSIRMVAPAISIDVSPADDPELDDSQTIHQGQTAYFSVTVTNTGGFSLSNVVVTDALAPECDNTFSRLEVGESTEPYLCGVIVSSTITNLAKVTAVAKAQNADLQAVNIPVDNSDTSEVIYEPVNLGIHIAESQIIRDGTEAKFTITVTVPTETAVENVTVSVVAEDNSEIQTSLTQCDKDFGDVTAGELLAPYSCSALLAVGAHKVSATAQGKLPGTEGPLSPPAQSLANVTVISPGLNIIAVSPAETVDGQPTVRKGEQAPITITVVNNGNEAGNSLLTGVTVENSDGYPAVVDCDHNLAALGDIMVDEQFEIKCFSNVLDAPADFVFTVTGTAADGSDETAESEMISIDILEPSTAIRVSEHSTMSMRVIIQTMTVSETNDGDSPLRDVKVDLSSNGEVALDVEPLTRNSIEYVGGDANDDSILDPGETWEWRVTTMSVVGDAILLPAGSQTLELTAVGYGIDQLNGEVTYPGDVEEIGTLSIPIAGN